MRPRRPNGRDGGLKNISPRALLDDSEQEEEVEHFQRSIAQSASAASKIGTSLAVVLVLIHVYFAAVQYARPFSLRHHRPFADSGADASLAVGELGSALAVAASALAINRFAHPRADGLSWKYALNVAILVTALQMVYWVAAGASVYVVSLSGRSGAAVPWGLIWWKPVPAMLMFALAVTSIDSISKMQIDLGLMRKSRYRFKTI